MDPQNSRGMPGPPEIHPPDAASAEHMTGRCLVFVDGRSMPHVHSTMHHASLPRLDVHAANIRSKILPHCRLKPGEIWRDEVAGHSVGCGDATDRTFILRLVGEKTARLAIQDPPYNFLMFPRQPVTRYIQWCQSWVDNCREVLHRDSALYVWMGADQDNHFQPLPQFMALMARTSLRSRSFITVRNQRGYGTQRNWMAVRQELLYYTQGSPVFNVQYTEIPKILRGYYKKVGGVLTENVERGGSDTIRPGNVWVDTQQVFYRMEENVAGCYAQKPLPAIERIVLASSDPGDLIVDFFVHSGSTLVACERTGRRCAACDIDPVFAEIAIRRLEHYRRTGRLGWQAGNPFEAELAGTNAPDRDAHLGWGHPCPVRPSD